jgi:DNA-binding protein Fis
MSENVDNLDQIDDISLHTAVEQTVKRYLLSSSDKKIVDLYSLVMEEIEMPLYKIVMEHCRYNQSRAAIVLGISRGTLRAKLKRYFDDQYVGTRG